MDEQNPDHELVESTRPTRSTLGITALACAIGAIVFFALGAWIIEANTPAPPPPAPPISLNDVANELKRELAEKTSLTLDDAKSSLKNKWAELTESSEKETDTKGNADQTPEEVGSAGKAGTKEPPQDKPIDVDITTGADGWRFGISFGNAIPIVVRPTWVDLLEKSLLFIILGGSAAGVILGIASQVRGEYPAWGIAAEAIGTATIGLTLMAIWLAMIVAVVAALVFVAVLSALTGVSFDLSI